jgi:hypothetical protein
VTNTVGPRLRRPRLFLVVGGLAVAVAVTGVAIGLSRSPQPNSTPAAGPAPVLPPVDLKAETGFEPFEVKLIWSAPWGGPELTRYEVFQGDTKVGSIGATSTNLTDHAVEPGTTYTYTVVAVSGDRRSAPVTLKVEVPVPSLSAARVVGNYDVSARATSYSGFSSFRRRPRFDLVSEPRCSRGACDWIVRLSGVKEVKFRLHRKGGRYTGSGTGRFNVSCGSVLMVSRLDIDVRVVKAVATAPTQFIPTSQWVASRLEGTMEVVQDPQLGCDGSQAVYAITLT